MSKPICVIYYSDRIADASGKMANIAEVTAGFQSKLPDYHVFAIPQDDERMKAPVEFNVYYDKDFTEIQYAELKSIIEKRFQKLSK